MKKLTYNTFKNTVLLLVLSFFMVLTVNAQKIDCAKVPDTNPNELPSLLKNIGEADFSYFSNIRSLKKYSNIIYEGVSVDCFKNKRYKMTSSSKNAKLDVTYGNDGNLIKGRLVKIDSHLPFLIRKHLPAYSLDRWKMISNKTFIFDFNPMRTEYEVELLRDEEKMTLFFDYTGKQIKRLSRS